MDTIGIVLAINQDRLVLCSNGGRGWVLPGSEASSLSVSPPVIPRDAAAYGLARDTGYVTYGKLVFLARGPSTPMDIESEIPRCNIDVFLATRLQPAAESPRCWTSWVKYDLLLRESPRSEFYKRVIGEHVEHLRDIGRILGA